jgi:ribosomal protein L21E
MFEGQRVKIVDNGSYRMTIADRYVGRTGYVQFIQEDYTGRIRKIGVSVHDRSSILWTTPKHVQKLDY